MNVSNISMMELKAYQYELYIFWNFKSLFSNTTKKSYFLIRRKLVEINPTSNYVIQLTNLFYKKFSF